MTSFWSFFSQFTRKYEIGRSFIISVGEGHGLDDGKSASMFGHENSCTNEAQQKAVSCLLIVFIISLIIALKTCRNRKQLFSCWLRVFLSYFDGVLGTLTLAPLLKSWEIQQMSLSVRFFSFHRNEAIKCCHQLRCSSFFLSRSCLLARLTLVVNIRWITSIAWPISRSPKKASPK